MTAKRKQISLQDRYEALMSISAKTRSRKSVCLEFDVTASTIAGWVKDKDSIISNYNQQRTTANMIRQRPLQHPELDQALKEWFHNLSENRVKASSTIIIQKAYSLPKNSFYFLER